ncbi:MAG: PilZ domain-containing protein [Vicinamibacterales bacterium]
MAESGSGAERRTGDRTEILGGLRGEVMVYQAMTVRDISHGGAQVETAFPLLIDSLHDLRLSLADAAVVVKGRVVYCRIASVDAATVTYRSGLEFIQPSSGVLSVISHFIDSVRGGVPGL